MMFSAACSQSFIWSMSFSGPDMERFRLLKKGLCRSMKESQYMQCSISFWGDEDSLLEMDNSMSEDRLLFQTLSWILKEPNMVSQDCHKKYINLLTQSC